MIVRRASGFTLVELIAVIVVLALTSVIGAGFVVDVVDQYQKASLRSSLVQRGTVVMEQMSRKLRLAAPNSIRVSSSAACVEYMPLVAASVYREAVPDTVNGKPTTNTLNTIAFTVLSGDAQFALIAPMSSVEVYSGLSENVRAQVSSLGASPHTQITLANNHRFVRNSVANRVLFADSPERFCVLAGRLVNYRDYGFSVSAMDDTSPGGAAVVMAEGVGADSAFVLTASSENRNAALDISIQVSGGTETVALSSRVLIRNVP